MHNHARTDICHDSRGYAIYEAYFITICTVQKICYLGQVSENNMMLSEIGNKVNTTIQNINSKTDTPIIDSYVIMPNHIHLLIDLLTNSTVKNVPFIFDIVRDLKSFTTTEYNRPHGKSFVPLWQRGYYDHRIRNRDERIKIEQYINDNPRKWAEDKFYVVQ